MGRGSLRQMMGGGVVALDSDRDIFSISGPFHLTSIDWNNSYHRTSVASSLVNGVYILERDRQERRVGSGSLAMPWWDFFNFSLVETLIDDYDGSIYGAVIWTLINTLHHGSRSMHAIRAIRNVVDKHNHSAIWLAGHSLGAALVLLAGKTMTRFGYFLESYIFNPPISSIPLEQLPGGDMLKGMFQITKSVVKATVAIALTDLHVQEEDPKTASWIPYLYVNSADPICAGFIDYFKRKTFMSKIGASKIEKAGSGKSVRCLLLERKGKSSSSDLSTEPLHLLPSADMIVNKNKPTTSMTAHGLHQWWERDPTLRENWESCCIRPKSKGKLHQLTIQ
ncbi:hypothetical protein ARALYDRAFT_910448 [Arabidopsis lyrata subsp. lyrata]|uniref:Fungal lipase-type domain-containing protein n=1 Tax=Arabidopsis lyrata subsp. lyrata TaxID=81972 RepID=D7M314_ARALL|nr:hypothetical protein ARALYDRAFT_910448 [Arabidopsis lyrata subsp. lyrata]